MKLYLLRSKQFKQTRNQRLHLMDDEGRTYCQTENVKRGGPADFIEIDEAEAGRRPICLSCLTIKQEREHGPAAESAAMSKAFGERT